MFHFLPAIRFAVRKYRRAPGPALAAVLTLALGIGANAAIFSLVDGVTLRPLAIADPAHLVSVASVKTHAAADSERDTTSSFPEYQDLRAGIPAFADVAGVDHRGIALKTADGIELLTAEVVTDNFFTFLGARPELGHLPTETELSHSQAPVIVISHATWRRVFGGDPSVIGRTVTATGHTAIVAAVVPPAFRGVQRIMDPQVYVPRSTWAAWFPSDRDSPRTFRNFDLYARLRPGATLDQARAQLRIRRQPASPHASRRSNNARTFSADWEQKSQFSQFRLLSILLLAVGAAVLLLACVNIANLLLAINDARRREIAMRSALGGTRGNLIGQLVTEYALLAVAGIAFALALAQWLISAVPAFIPDTGFPSAPISASTSASSPSPSLPACSPSSSAASFPPSPPRARRRLTPCATAQASRGRFRMPARKIFVVAQVAVSMALLVVTGLFVRSLLRIESANLGFSSRQNAAILEMSINRDGPQRQAELSAMAARVRALPGVKRCNRLARCPVLAHRRRSHQARPRSRRARSPIPPAPPSGSTRSTTTTSASWVCPSCAAAPSAPSTHPPPCASSSSTRPSLNASSALLTSSAAISAWAAKIPLTSKSSA